MLRRKLAFFMAMLDSKKTITIYTLPKILEVLGDGNIDYKVYGNSLQSELPDGYTRLEYLESTGTQSIDTGINPTVAKSTEIQIKLSETVITGSGSGFGLNLSLNAVNTSSGYWRLNGIQTNTTRQVGEIFNITLKQTSQGRYYNINGEEGYGSNSEPSGSFCIGVLGESPSYNLRAKWYYCKILENNQLVQNLIPARRNSDNVLGMYDTISNTFLTNAGTGEFIAGGVVVPTPSTPMPIESVGDKTKNLFDGKTDIVIGEYIVSATGVVGDSRYNYYCDTYFEVKPNISYVFWGEKKADNTLSAYNRIHWYNSAKTFISSAQYGQSARCVGIAPSNAKYARISCNTLDSNLTLTQEDINSFNWYFGEGNASTSYEPYGYKVPIEIKGKNLADINSVIRDEYVVARSTDADFGSVKSNAAWSRTDYIEIEPNTTYTIYFDDIVAAAAAGLCIYDGNKNVLVGYSTNFLKTNTHNITTPENAKYLIMSISRTGSVTSKLAIYKQDGTYENVPYTSTTATVYLDEPLRKIGNYADYIDSETQTVVRNVGYVVLDSTSSFSAYLDNCWASSGAAPGKPSGNIRSYCTHYSWANKTPNTIAQGEFCLNGTSRLSIKDDRFESATDFRAFLADQYNAGTPVTVIYPLATPTTESVVLPALAGTTGTITFDVDTVVKPTQVDLSGNIGE